MQRLIRFPGLLGSRNGEREPHCAGETVSWDSVRISGHSPDPGIGHRTLRLRNWSPLSSLRAHSQCLNTCSGPGPDSPLTTLATLRPNVISLLASHGQYVKAFRHAGLDCSNKIWPNEANLGKFYTASLLARTEQIKWKHFHSLTITWRIIP